MPDDAPATRDVGVVGDAFADAEGIGEVLASSLLAGDVGDAYDVARRRCRQAGRRLRITLSLGEMPELLDLPWELMYRHTGFVGCQRDTPLVRHLPVGEPAGPPAIEHSVRMLVVLASPSDLPRLDTEAERRIIEAATRPIVDARRLEVDWLVGASLISLHRALRDQRYHILHFVGHGGPGRDGAGALYLQDERHGRSVEVSAASLRTLLDLQRELRVVVLNSCHGARSGSEDSTRHLVGALVERGVPAVVGMQFPISDAAALTFAAEFYRHLIGEQESIDVAVAAARLAIYVEVDRLEWATPVLYVRDTSVELFRFLVAALIVPPIVAAGQQVWPAPATPTVSSHAIHTVAAARPRGVLPYILTGAATVGVGVAVLVLWPDDQPALAGTWTTDDWNLAIATPGSNPNSLGSYRFQIAPEPESCPDDQCALEVTLDNQHFSVPVDVSFAPAGPGNGWIGSMGHSWNCVDDNDKVTLSRASEGTATWTLRREGDELALKYSYVASTSQDTDLCVPVREAEFTTTLHND